MAGSDDEIPPPPPPLQTQTPTQQAPHTVSTIKLPILKKEEYDIWAMKMKHYLAHTDYPIWEVIQRGNGHVSVSTDTDGVIKEAIKSRFGGNDESKKMQKYILKQQFEASLYQTQKGCIKAMQFFQMDHNWIMEEIGKQLDEFDLEEMDLKWQVAMISMRLKKFYKKTGRKSKGNQDSTRRDDGYTRYKAKDSERRPGKQEEPKALVTLDGEGVDWTSHSEDEQEYYALMAYNNSGSDTEVTSCSKECKESYAKLKKLYDEQREQLGDASIEIQAYTQALKKVLAQLIAHQQNQLWYEEKIRFMKIDLDDKTDVLTYHKKL
ncbi:hypothetical protein Tco_1064505 [Tanacetum coccineum]